MALPTASDNVFPKLILDEGGTLGTVTAGERRLGIDANGVLVWKNSAGTTSPLAALNKWDATTAPTANDDSGDGYQVGSRWIDVTNNKEYVCLDATVAAAVWTETTGAGSGGSLGAWTSYTPTLSGITALGNGIIEGRYKALDATTYAIIINFQVGSTTDLTGASVEFSLPSGVTAAATPNYQVLAAHFLDAGAAHYAATSFISAGSSVIYVVVGDATGTRLYSKTTPVTGANGDQVNIQGVLEVAVA